MHSTRTHEIRKIIFFILIKFLVVGGFYYSELSNHFNLQLQKVIALTLYNYSRVQAFEIIE